MRTISLRSTHFARIRILLFVVVFSAALYVFIASFTIRTVTVTGVAAQTVIDPQSFPSNLLFFPEERVKHELLAAYPQFEHISFTKQYPGTLIIHVTLRKPVARIVTESRSIAVDDKGMVLGESVDLTLPAIVLPIASIHVGTYQEGRGISTSLAFLSVIGQDHIEAIRLTEANTLEVKMNEMIILLDQNSDGSSAARTLQGLLASFRIRGTQPKVVDLRFTKPIVTF